MGRKGVREKSPVDVKNAFLRVPAMGIMCHVGNINQMNEGLFLQVCAQLLFQQLLIGLIPMEKTFLISTTAASSFLRSHLLQGQTAPPHCSAYETCSWK